MKTSIHFNKIPLLGVKFLSKEKKRQKFEEIKIYKSLLRKVHIKKKMYFKKILTACYHKRKKKF